MSTEQTPSFTYSGPGPNYCCHCYGAAEKAGRDVREVAPDLRLCVLCEWRWREGLIHYVPSNGIEGRMFERQCDRCRHDTDDGESPPRLTVPGKLCMWAIKDRLFASGWCDSDSSARWYSPDDLDASTYPARCRRFTSKDDDDGALRDPPPPDCVGQMMLEEVLAMPIERAIDGARVTAAVP